MKRRASDDVCGHVASASLQPPSASQDVCKDECMWCFDSQDTPTGVAVCMHCFLAGCLAQAHAGRHCEQTGHALALWLRRTPKPAAPITRLAVVDVPDDERYDYERRIVCMACDTKHGRELRDVPAPIQAVASAIVHATSHAHKAEVHAWEEDIVPCAHTQALEQDAVAAPSLGGDASCARCELTSNLWMCLQCGHLGCGRAQFGGVAGHSHALAHYEQTGHPCSVKQGTITPEGSGDVYCYACNDARIDPALDVHLRALGVPVATLSKTEKSSTELQLEQNIQFDFRMVDDDGHAMRPAYGPGHTGIQNLGNSCYLASIIQAVWSIPAFRERYGHDAWACASPWDLECQLRKLTDGLGSGRYAEGDAPRGIRPAMLKACLGRGHPEFASMRQQDAEEFLQHLVTVLRRESHPEGDPTRVFGYVLEHRLQCTACRRVRYTEEAVDVGVGLPVPVRGTDGSYEDVSLRESFDALVAPDTIQYTCPSCARSVTATKQTRFATLPDVLVVQAQRFQLVNWVPQKMPVRFQVPLTESLDMSAYLGHGQRDDEEALPDEGHVAVDPEAMATLSSLGFADAQVQQAWRATGGDLEASAHWLLEHGASVDEGATPLQVLQDMGFSHAQSRKALRLHGDVEAAVAWLFDNPDDPGDDDTAEPTPTQRLGTRSPTTYQLMSFVTHRGPSVHSGHYVAHVRDDTGWVFYNDDKVVHAPMHGTSSSVSALSDMAYLYFFRRTP